MKKCILCNKETNGNFAGTPLCEECYKDNNYETFTKKIKEKYKCIHCFDTGVVVSRIGMMEINNPCVHCKKR